MKGFSGQYYDQHRQNERFQLARMAQAAAGSASEGITTTRDCGAFATINLVIRDAIEAGFARGPRVVTCGQVIQPFLAQEGVKPPGMTRDATDAADVARIAEALCDEGVDFIKVKAWRTAFGTQGKREFTAAEMRAAFDVAHRRGKRTACHAWEPTEIAKGLEAGADSIEHALYGHKDLALFEEMAARGTYLVPCWDSWSRSWSVNLPKEEQRNADHRRAVETAIRLGVPTDAGTDLYAPSLVDEIRALAEFGLGSHGAIQAATRVAAELADLASDIGMLAPGKRADLIAVEGDPLRDLDVLRRPKVVMKAGVIDHSRERLAPAAP